MASRAEKPKPRHTESPENTILRDILYGVINKERILKEEAEQKLQDRFRELQIEKIAHEINTHAFNGEAAVGSRVFDVFDLEENQISIALTIEHAVRRAKDQSNPIVLDMILRAVKKSFEFEVNVYPDRAPKDSLVRNYTGMGDHASIDYKITKTTTADELRKKIGNYLKSLYEPPDSE